MKKLLILLLLSTTIMFAKNVIVEGIAVIKSSKTNAKKEALLDAKIKAVESAIGSYIKSETTMKNYEIEYDIVEERLEGYISKYKILKESSKDNILTVKIKANVVKGKIYSEIEDLTSHLNYNENPRFMIISTKDKVVSSIFESQIRDSLLKNKIEVVQLNQLKSYYQNMINSSSIDKNSIPFTRMGVDYVVYLDITRQNIDTTYKGEKHKSIRLYVSANVINTSSMETLVQKTYPSKAAHNKIIVESALIPEVKAIASNFGKNLLISINDKWNEKMFNGENIILEVVGIKSFKNLQMIKEYFQEIIPDIKSIYEKSFTSNQAMLNIKIQGGVNKFVDELIFNNEKYEIEILKRDKNQLKIKIK